MALPFVYPAPTDGTVAADCAWVSDLCSVCGRVISLTIGGLMSRTGELIQPSAFAVSVPVRTKPGMRAKHLPPRSAK